ncbi:uncharacterized protein [Branchiostoma lanceolatum]|uniref:uncharacterized protein n=1 Tax=Branchiostoma lanceolatum TaxID=7740 RepID=UPI003454A277
MPPIVSKLATVFPADQMVELLRHIDENVRLIVSTMREQGAQVRGKVTVLLDKYLDLLSGALRECMLFRNFIEMLQRNLEGIENTLTLVKNGTVSEVLADLRLEKYVPKFEKEDLHFAYQLMTANFDVEQLDLPTRAAKVALHDRIQEYRVDLSTIKARIEEVKREGGSCFKSCREITQKFKTFLQEIKGTQESIISLLGENRDHETEMCVASLVVLGASAALLLTCVGFAATACCVVFAPVAFPLEVAIGIAIASGIASGVTGLTAWSIHKKKKEMESVGKALEELQAQLDAMHFDASKQKTDWEKIETQAEKIAHYISNSKMERTADGLNPSHRRPVQEVLDGVQVVLEDAALLQANVVQFKKEAERVQGNLRDLSLLKESDKVLTVPAKASASPIQGLFNMITGLVKAFKKRSNSDPSELTSTLSKAMKLQ